jgi:hypothetical protein
MLIERYSYVLNNIMCRARCKEHKTMSKGDICSLDLHWYASVDTTLIACIQSILKDIDIKVVLFQPILEPQGILAPPPARRRR